MTAYRKNTQQYLISNTKKFIIPYIFFSVAGTLIALITAIPLDKSLLQIILNECRSVIFTGSTNFNGPLWFLLTLFFVRVSFNYVRNLINHYILIAILLIIAFAHYLFIANHGIWWLGNFCSGLIFYILGMKLKDLQYTKNILLLSIVIILAIGIIKPTIVTMFGNFLLYDDGIYILWYPYSLAGIIVFNNIIKYIGKALKHYNLDDIGQHSMVYYVIHYPLGLLICSFYERYSSLPNKWELLVYLCVMWFVLLPLITYIFNNKSMSKFIGK